MVRLTSIHAGDHFGSLPLAVGLFITVSAVVALCTKHARRVSRKHETEPTDSKFVPQKPLRLPWDLMTTISNKAISFIHHRKNQGRGKDWCQISEMPPRSPRTSPLPSFAFPVTTDAN
ncbi:hypothetical protein Acr_29g0004760 [Actinidia rufa]|uniref:Transmembrane protein n=1 Tax=Actinidia rufa TaxID=165716 RepID=A0A7J0HF23_9ERIC|nr:hypothetical protein Acr_29g0004760 [Actinidia rufa]